MISNATAKAVFTSVGTLTVVFYPGFIGTFDAGEVSASAIRMRSSMNMFFDMEHWQSNPQFVVDQLFK